MASQMVDILTESILRIFNFFFVDHFPDVGLILKLLPISILWVILALSMGNQLRIHYSWKVGYTRKLFHFMMFGTAGIFQYRWGIPGVFILGWAITGVLTYVLWKSANSAWFHVLARPSDAPYESRYIIYPYLATFAGGVASNLFFIPEAVIAGYLIAGLGDAIGEPVGTRWGRHPYKVPSYGTGKPHYRSLEGSAAVWIACLFSYLSVSMLYNWDIQWIKLLTAASLATLTEAFSPHGWDNFTAQFIGTALAFYLLVE
jgi:phytol kinase